MQLSEMQLRLPTYLVRSEEALTDRHQSIVYSEDACLEHLARHLRRLLKQAQEGRICSRPRVSHWNPYWEMLLSDWLGHRDRQSRVADLQTRAEGHRSRLLVVAVDDYAEIQGARTTPEEIA
jgi:hypothetical protein